MAQNNAGYQGTLDASKGFGDYNQTAYIIRQILTSTHTATLVMVKAVTNSGGVTPVGSVDVQPLVNMLDGQGNAVPHGVVYGLPYFRLQGGANAVILDPQVGDMGIAIFAESDLSGVKSIKGQANPGSGRKFDMADGLYLGGFLNGTPIQYVQFSASGIVLVSPQNVTIQAPTITLVGQVNQSGGTIAAAQDISVNGLSVLNHNHTDPQGGTVGPMQG